MGQERGRILGQLPPEGPARVAPQARVSWPARLVLVLEAAGLLALLVLALLLDHSMRTSLQVEVGQVGDAGYLIEGFYGREHAAAMPTAAGTEAADFRWTADRAELRLAPLATGTPYVLRLRLLGLEAAAVGKPATLSLLLNRQKVLQTVVLPRLAEYTVVVPASASATGEMYVALQVSPTVRVEGRVLGVVVNRVTLRATGEAGAVLSSFFYPPPPYALALLCAYAAAWLAGLAVGWRLLPSAGLGLVGLLACSLWPLQAPHLGTLLAVGAGVVLAVLGVWRFLAHFPPRPKHFPRWLLIAFLVGLLAVFVPGLTGDGRDYYAFLRSVAMDGDLDFSNDLSPAVNPFLGLDALDLTRRTPTGLVANPFSVGPAILWSPFFALAHGIVLAGRALGMPWQVDGFAEPYVLLVTFGSAFFSLAAMALLYALCRRHFSSGAALAGTLLAFLGTTWFYYAFLEGSFPHALGAFSVTLFLFLWWWAGENWGWQRGLVLGLGAGLMCLVYWIQALFLIVLAPLAWQFVRSVWQRQGPSWRRQLGAWIAFALGGSVAFAPQLAAWKVLYGQFLAVPQGSSFASPSGFWLGPLLFSPLHGLFLWTPVTLLAAAGLVFLVRRVPRHGWPMIAAVVLYLLYNAVLESWHGKGAFGMRRLTSAVPFFTLGLAALWDWGKRFRFPWPAILGSLATVWHFLVLLRYRFYGLPHVVGALADLKVSEFALSPGNAPLSATFPLAADGLAAAGLRACTGAGGGACAAGLFFLALLVALSVGCFLLLSYWLRLGEAGLLDLTSLPGRG